MKNKEWLEFRETPQLPRGKTKRFDVCNKDSKTVIGSIKWYPQWRHYCFFPEEFTVYSDRCLEQISKFITEMNINHKDKTRRTHTELMKGGNRL